MLKVFKPSLFAITGLLLFYSFAFSGEFLLKQFLFDDQKDLNSWKEMVLDGKVDYFIEIKDENGFVHALSENACSAIYHRVGYKPVNFPVLTWKWSVLKFPEKDPANPVDDYAARIYAIFPSISFSTSKFIEYIWAEDLPEGHIQQSPSAKNIMQIVVRSGRDNAGKWFEEKRNIYDDYELVFGKKAKTSVGAIAIMCNSNITKSTAECLVDNIKIEKLSEPGTESPGTGSQEVQSDNDE
ncbi:MAG: DUF3047 domain-containing protein [Candidatus Omnitrophota bacterium]